MIGIAVASKGFQNVIADMAIIIHVSLDIQTQVDRSDLLFVGMSEHIIIDRRNTVIRAFFIDAVTFPEVDDLPLVDRLAFKQIPESHQDDYTTQKGSWGPHRSGYDLTEFVDPAAVSDDRLYLIAFLDEGSPQIAK